MKIVLLGAPGAGKGTQAGSISAKYGIPHISTGDMFRAAIGGQTPTGIKAKLFIDRGELVPDSVTIEMVEERLSQPDCASGYLLDGFPRTIPQAEALEKISGPDCVLNLQVPESLLMNRLTGRRVCESCKGTFHISRLSGAEVCPVCGGKLIHRKDDQAETIAERLNVYHRDTQPLIEYYRGRGKLIEVDGSKTPEEVDQAALKALEDFR